MTLEIQSAYIKPILDELMNIDRIINQDHCKVNKETEEMLVKIYEILGLE